MNFKFKTFGNSNSCYRFKNEPRVLSTNNKRDEYA